jgi:hypothetical protein
MSVQELKIREVDTRIETEIANLRTAIETAKVGFQTLLDYRTAAHAQSPSFQQSTLQYLVTVGQWQLPAL